MEKRDLQKQIRKDEGYILSDGTLKLDILLSKAHSLIVGYGLRTPLEKEILQEFVYDSDYSFCHEFGSLLSDVINDYCSLKNDESAFYLWNEDIYYFFNEIAPKGFYFGSNYGDGACIGWFKDEEELY